MEGVEVLNTAINSSRSIAGGIFAIILCIIGVFMLVSVIYYIKEFPDYDTGAAGVTTWLSIVVFCLSAIGIYQSFFRKETTYYQILIDDSVSMVEFNKKYDIVEVEGKIYTIQEKEN